MTDEKKPEKFKTPREIDEEKVAEHRARVEEKQRKEEEKAEAEEEKRKAAEAKHLAAEAERMAKEQEKREKIRAVRQQENDVFKALADEKGHDYKSLVSNCYTEMDSNTDMVLKGISYGTIVEGRGGTGKTYRILNQCLRECGADNVAYTDSYTTPASFYVWLYKNRDKRVCIIDDCAGFMNNDKILAFLKGALWHTNDGKTRIVNYMTTKPLNDEYGEPIPSTCEVECRLIIITNWLDDEKPHVKAVLSRVNRIRVDVPYKELLSILEQVIKKEYKSLTDAERKQCLEFLMENTSKNTPELNIRTLLRVMDYREYAKQRNAGDLWRTLSLKLLERDDRLLLVEKIVEDKSFQSEAERFEAFAELTGESQATFYRLKKKLEKMLKERRERKEEAALNNDKAIKTAS